MRLRSIEHAAPLPGPAALREPDVRVDARAKVTGAALYAADVTREGMLWTRTVTSPHPHARIVAVDTAGAWQVPGVHAVLTGDDVRPARFGRRLLDQPVLAWERVRFVGERVAAVAAETVAAAEEAARRIVVRYEELPAVLDPGAALRPGAPVLHPEPGEYAYLGGQRPPVGHPNVQGHARVERGGDSAAVFASADHVFEHTFTTPRQYHAYLEPRATLVWIDPDGNVHVRSTNKGPESLRRQMAATTGLPVDRIVVDSGYIGGEFGGKGYSVDEFLCYFLARASGRPVKAVMPYAEDLRATCTRHASWIRVRTAVRRDGRFLARQAEVLFDGGAYAAAKPQASLSLGGASAVLGAYAIEHTRLDVRIVYTNAVPGGHMRSPGHMQSSFAGESQVDVIAETLGIDPLELRLRNAVRGAEAVGPAGQVYAEPRAVEVLEQLAHASATPPAAAAGERGAAGMPGVAKRRGRGMALDARSVGAGGTANVELRLRADGMVEITTGLADQGGGAETVATRVVAAALTIPPSQVEARKGTTATALPNVDVGGSRVTNVISRAAHAGGLALAERLETRACEVLGLPPGSVRLHNGAFVGPGGTGKGRILHDMATELLAPGPLEAVGTGGGGAPGPGQDHNFVACQVDVEVDTETGEVTVSGGVVVLDVGAVINPLAHQGQIDGGFVFGLGAALHEDLPVRDGRVLAAGLDSYRIPRMRDVPRLRVVLLPTETGPGAFGAKAVGEHVNTAVAPAIANAVADAVGVRVTTTPITPERVLEALGALGQRSAP